MKSGNVWCLNKSLKSNNWNSCKIHATMLSRSIELNRANTYCFVMSWSQINFTQLELHFLVESLTKYTTRKVQGSRGKKLSSFVYSELFCLTVGEYLKTFKPVKKNIAKKLPDKAGSYENCALQLRTGDLRWCLSWREVKTISVLLQSSNYCSDLCGKNVCFIGTTNHKNMTGSNKTAINLSVSFFVEVSLRYSIHEYIVILNPILLTFDKQDLSVKFFPFKLLSTTWIKPGLEELEQVSSRVR